LIANILNEDYSKLNQIIRENIKAVLSDNKIFLSASFAALIQTLKIAAEMVKLIQNIPSANDGEQDKDNNITQYFESNKDSILYLTEKHYENLVEALTHDVINRAADSSSSPNLTLSLPQSSSTFPGPSNKIAIYRIEEPKNYHNSKYDISD
jgi:hypothetical protein